jgi:hypothetical protein
MIATLFFDRLSACLDHIAMIAAAGNCHRARKHVDFPGLEA